MRFLPAVVVIVVLAGVVGALLAAAYRRHPDARGRARALRRIVLGFMGVFVVGGAFFIAGETFADPGGWKGAGLVALWLVPAVALSLWAWFRPDPAGDALEVLVVLTVGLAVWYALDAGSWRSFENAHGPIRAVALFALAAPLTLLGYHRPKRGGILLLGASVLPVVLAGLASGGLGMTSLGAIAGPAFVAGVLDLVSVTLRGVAGELAPPTEPAHRRRAGPRGPTLPLGHGPA